MIWPALGIMDAFFKSYLEYPKNICYDSTAQIWDQFWSGRILECISEMAEDLSRNHVLILNCPDQTLLSRSQDQRIQSHDGALFIPKACANTQLPISDTPFTIAGSMDTISYNLQNMCYNSAVPETTFHGRWEYGWGFRMHLHDLQYLFWISSVLEPFI